jgi:hypothetical protein
MQHSDVVEPQCALPPSVLADPKQEWLGESLQQLRARLARFAAERDWGQYHTPRNLLLALVGEVGEVAEHFQWRGEVAPGLPDFTKDGGWAGGGWGKCLLHSALPSQCLQISIATHSLPH